MTTFFIGSVIVAGASYALYRYFNTSKRQTHDRKMEEEISKIAAEEDKDLLSSSSLSDFVNSSSSSAPVPEAVVEAKKVEEAKKVLKSLVLKSGEQHIKGRRSEMEDAHVNFDALETVDDFKDIVEGFPGPRAFYGIYDGHNGAQAAEYLAEKLHHSFITSNTFLTGDFKEALRSTFVEVDDRFCESAKEKRMQDGSTAAVCVIIGNKLYSANAGDAEVVVGRKTESGDGFESITLSRLHKPADPEEKARIMSEGGLVLRGRVGGILAVARAFGDLGFKTPIDDGDIKIGKLVTAEPFVAEYELVPDRDQFVIIGCDGVWEAMSKDQSNDVVASNLHEDPSTISDLLVNKAYELGSNDNISAIVVKLLWE
eukprot:CAMPEP_0184336958 /NCGR_PEP_ID=MMETSP1089-20130417/5233_1 /TAXON_ID=38269 ORGANISM="Gloeochaete wittrockiana, Strain SAG46.84" /NCGR_SAMPLE_ID=MMETSP1089 /ASSEMBLY_ACC=CAM_ASM_000445 /LENGTH=369 /DNA_ID=CAMNT_0026662265 /DNA_START=65 /DNA_END=1174 /DNA_ORIENTATION=-